MDGHANLLTLKFQIWMSVKQVPTIVVRYVWTLWDHSVVIAFLDINSVKMDIPVMVCCEYIE